MLTVVFKFPPVVLFLPTSQVLLIPPRSLLLLLAKAPSIASRLLADLLQRFETLGVLPPLWTFSSSWPDEFNTRSSSIIGYNRRVRSLVHYISAEQHILATLASSSGYEVPYLFFCVVFIFLLIASIPFLH